MIRYRNFSLWYSGIFSTFVGLHIVCDVTVTIFIFPVYITMGI